SRAMPTIALFPITPAVQAQAEATRLISFLPLISSTNLGRGAIVCDISRPPNISPNLADERPDVFVVNGGIFQAPGGCSLAPLGEPDRPDVLVACAAETMVLALAGFRGDHLCGRLDVGTIGEIGRLAEEQGLAAVV